MKRTSFVRILAGAMLVSAGVTTQISMEAMAMNTESSRLRVEGDFPSLAGATDWLNSPPLSTEALRGKVVLVDFWTYTCINWLRTLPYVRAWAAKYKDQGLVVIGVHSPEFELEKDMDNVRRAVKEMDVVYPVAVDSNHSVWRAFDNQYWPALYFVDAQGHIRHHVFGEGEYEESERILQELLREAGAKGVSDEIVKVDAHGLEMAADWRNLKSGENYVGYERAENFASPGGVVEDERRVYSSPSRLALNQWALSGDWTMGPQSVVLNAPRGIITYSFHARDLHLVMGPVKKGSSVRFRVLVDGRAPGADHGTDVDAEGNGTVTDQRLYQLIRQAKGVEDREFKIEFLEPGVQVLAFTFG